MASQTETELSSLLTCVQFCEEMAKRDYSYWKIPIFNLEVYRPNPPKCDAVLKNLFPRIRVECFKVERRLQDLGRSWWRVK